MSFFKYNIYKVLTSYAGIALFLMLFSDALAHAPVFYALRFAIPVAFFITAFIVLIGANNFYVRERLLFGTPDNSILDEFDNDSHSIDLKRNGHLFLFVQQELSGTISGYPVRVKLDPTKDATLRFNSLYTKPRVSMPGITGRRC